MIYVYTSIIDGFDNLRPPACPVDEDVRYICFTNVPNLPRVYPWEYRPAYIAGEPCRSARIPKILPHLILPDDATHSIYHDGNFQLRMDPHAMIRELLDRHDWAAHKHPCRNCIYQESDVLLKEKIGTRELVEKEIARYRADGYPEGQGLWANGLIVRAHTAGVADLNERWWSLYSSGCERDQISFPVARHQRSFPINTINRDIWQSPYLLYNWHAAFKTRDNNPDYWPQRDRVRGRLTALKEITGSDSGIHHHEY